MTQWAQEQAVIEEHRLEKQRRSKVRAQVRDELRITYGLAENSIVDISIRPLNLTLKSHQKPLLDADSDDDDDDDEDPTTTTHYKTSTFGFSDIHQSSTSLKALLEKDDDDDEEPQTTAK